MTAYELTKQRYYNLIKQDKPNMPEAEVAKEAKMLTDDWKMRRGEGCEERCITNYDLFGNV